MSHLDSSQAIVLSALEDKIVVKAPAGSGKTTLLIEIIKDYHKALPHHRISAITYTRAAKAEMEQRLMSSGVFNTTVQTIHSWSKTMVEKFALKYNFTIDIMQKEEIEEIMEDIIKAAQVRARYSRKFFPTVKVGILYNYVLENNKNMAVQPSFLNALKTLESEYVNYKRDNGLYDFTDLPLYLYTILTKYNEVIDGIDALFIDEFQDVDEIQEKIFKLVTAEKKLYIGDAWQSIYIFRGADGEVFSKLKDFEIYKLEYNYRSYQEIIDYACHLRARLSDSYQPAFLTSVLETSASPIKCKRNYGGEVFIVDIDENYLFVKDQKEKWLEIDIYEKIDEIISRNPRILCRTNKLVRQIENEGYINVSTIHQTKGLEYNDVVVIDMKVSDTEDLNISYVALTRARNSLTVIPIEIYDAYLQQKRRGRFK